MRDVEEKRKQDSNKKIILSKDAVLEVQKILEHIEFKESLMESIKGAVQKAFAIIGAWYSEPSHDNDDEVKTLNSENEIYVKEIAECEKKMEYLEKEKSELKENLNAKQTQKSSQFINQREHQEKIYELKESLSQINFKERELENKLSMLSERLGFLKREEEEYGVLLSLHIKESDYENIVVSENYDITQKRRMIDKLVLRIEEVGGGTGHETITEYEDLQKRFDVYTREIAELEDAKLKIYTLISELKETLDIEFKEGITKVSLQFQEFFTAMFGGGEAKILISKIQKRKQAEGDEEEESEEGIDIELTLPKKQTQSLNTLSGGERSLTSIALLFALSQVNPPPFLVLDETDAALDEANSKRYGDMLERLSKYSQIIVVTHNRETMSRADVLYGVTLEKTGSSMLLSVKFDDALQYAK